MQSNDFLCFKGPKSPIKKAWDNKENASWLI